MIGPKFAAAILFLLPVALVCAQNTPPGGTASPAKSPQAQPAVAPAQAAPAKAATAGAGSSQSSGESAAAKEPNRAQAYYHLALAGSV